MLLILHNRKQDSSESHTSTPSLAVRQQIVNFAAFRISLICYDYMGGDRGERKKTVVAQLISACKSTAEQDYLKIKMH